LFLRASPFFFRIVGNIVYRRNVGTILPAIFRRIFEISSFRTYIYIFFFRINFDIIANIYVTSGQSVCFSVSLVGKIFIRLLSIFFFLRSIRTLDVFPINNTGNRLSRLCQPPSPHERTRKPVIDEIASDIIDKIGETTFNRRKDETTGGLNTAPPWHEREIALDSPVVDRRNCSVNDRISGYYRWSKIISNLKYYAS